MRGNSYTADPGASSLHRGSLHGPSIHEASLHNRHHRVASGSSLMVDDDSDVDDFGGDQELSLDDVVPSAPSLSPRSNEPAPSPPVPLMSTKKRASDDDYDDNGNEEFDDHQTCTTAPSSFDDEQPASNGSWTSTSDDDNEEDDEATAESSDHKRESKKKATKPRTPTNLPLAASNAARLALLEKDMIAKGREVGGGGAVVIRTQHNSVSPTSSSAAAEGNSSSKPPPPHTHVILLHSSSNKTTSASEPPPTAGRASLLPPPPPTISRDIAQDLVLLEMRKKQKKRRSERGGGSGCSALVRPRATPAGAPLSRVYAENQLSRKSEYMEALHECAVADANDPQNNKHKHKPPKKTVSPPAAPRGSDALQPKNDLDDGEISVPSLWREKNPDGSRLDEGHTADGSSSSSSALSRVPQDLFNLEASIRVSQQHVTSLSEIGPGAFQVQAPAGGRPRPAPGLYVPGSASASASLLSLPPPPELTPYVVEARLVMDDPHDDDDDDDDGDQTDNSSGDDNDDDERRKRGRPPSARPSGREDDVEMALVEAKHVVEATPVYETSAWKKRCLWAAIALAVLAAVGAAIGITLGVTRSATTSSTPPVEEPTPTNGTRPSGGDPAPSNNSSTGIPNVFSEDPVGDFRSSLSNGTLMAIKDDTSPQAKAYKWTIEHLPTEGNVVRRMVQRFAMATIYYSSGGAAWDRKSGWLDASVHECDWYYDSSASLACYEGTDTIVRLGLSDNNLKGSLPLELGLLTSIESLLLSSNDGLIGDVTASITNMPSLSGVFMSQNALSGSLPNLHPSATYVYLWSNRFSGSFPEAYKNLTEVTDFVVRDNLLTGIFPEDMWRRWGKVESIDVSSNSLEGSIGKGIGELTRLTSLGLMSNQFTGTIPSELGKLTAVKDMYIGDNSLTSTIPTHIANMKDLTYLDLFNNRLSGTIPSELSRMSKLQELSLEANLLSGGFPTELSSLPNLVKVSLFGNALNGTIPTHIAAFTALTVLDLDFNNFEGAIPGALGDLPSINEIHVASNYLNGTIPTELGRLTGLSELDLSDNELTGTIPTELGTLTALQVLALNENYLTGSVPLELCALVALKSLDLHVDCEQVTCNCGCNCDSNATARLLS